MQSALLPSSFGATLGEFTLTRFLPGEPETGPKCLGKRWRRIRPLPCPSMSVSSLGRLLVWPEQLPFFHQSQIQA